MEFFRKLFWPITAPIVFIQNHFKATLLVLIVIFSIMQNDEPSFEPNLIKIDLYGAIFDADGFLKQVELAKKPHIKGVLLDVNSPGGAVSPSVEMMMAIADLKKLKPVVAYASGTMASGSYYASVASTKIFANPGSIVGSIGVIFEMTNFEKLLEKVGVEFTIVKSGEYKEAGTFYRKPTQEERAQIEELSLKTYQMFVADVAKHRRLDPKAAPQFANGRIFVAADALKLGLIDALGSYADAQNELVKLANVKEPLWYKKTRIDKFLDDLERESRSFVRSLLVNEKTIVSY